MLRWRKEPPDKPGWWAWRVYPSSGSAPETGITLYTRVPGSVMEDVALWAGPIEIAEPETALQRLRAVLEGRTPLNGKDFVTLSVASVGKALALVAELEEEARG